MKTYFKGGKGILNPVDVEGISIKEGDILTHCYFRDDFPQFFTRHYPKLTSEEIEATTMKPNVVVKWNPKGFFYGEGLTENEFGMRAYMHDFEFKFTKNLHM